MSEFTVININDLKELIAQQVQVGISLYLEESKLEELEQVEFRPHQAARFLGISTSTLARAKDRGDITPVEGNRGERGTRYTKAECLRFKYLHKSLLKTA